MGQSLSQLYVHLIFSTKNRYPFIKVELEKQLHAYLTGTLKKYDSPAILINSVPDHIHILFRMSKNYAISKIAKELKKQSSKWMKEIEFGHAKFAWQSGYGAFSVSSSKLNHVKNYIETQKTHHNRKSFKEEFEEFIKEYGVIGYKSNYFLS